MWIYIPDIEFKRKAKSFKILFVFPISVLQIFAPLRRFQL